MGVIISRYLDPCSSEGALIRFAVDSAQLVHTMCTADAHFPDLTPWNVIDFHTDDIFHSLTFIPCWPRRLSRLLPPSSPSPPSHAREHPRDIASIPPLPPPFSVEYEQCGGDASHLLNSSLSSSSSSSSLSSSPTSSSSSSRSSRSLRSTLSPVSLSVSSSLPMSAIRTSSYLSSRPFSPAAVSFVRSATFENNATLNEALHWLLQHTM